MLEDGLLMMPWDWSTDPDKEGTDKEKVGWQIPWDRSFVFALDAATGKLAWKTGRGASRIAHITPNIRTDETGRKQLVSGAGDVQPPVEDCSQRRGSVRGEWLERFQRTIPFL